ncbi:MAG: hypothetical protein N2560_06475 [Ignavibacteria bacterium]|nr:hypothetical protein [Ignavibacteria bacterium]
MSIREKFLNRASELNLIVTPPTEWREGVAIFQVITTEKNSEEEILRDLENLKIFKAEFSNFSIKVENSTFPISLMRLEVQHKVKREGKEFISPSKLVAFINLNKRYLSFDIIPSQMEV